MKGNICTPGVQRSKYIISDLVMTAIAFFLFNICRYEIIVLTHKNYPALWEYIFSLKMIFEYVLIPVALIGLYALSGFYNNPFFKSRLSVIANTIATSIIGAIVIYLVILLNDIGMRRYDYLAILILIALLFLFTYTGRYFITRSLIKKLRNREVISGTLIIGNSKESRKVAAQLEYDSPSIPYEIIGYVRLEGEDNIEDGSRIWDSSQIEDICRTERPDQIVIATQHRNERRVMELLDSMIHIGVPIRIAPDTLSYVTSNIRLGDIMGTPFVDLTSPQMSDWQKNLKRVLDVLISSIALVLLSPVYLVLAVAVKRSSPGPVIYSQERLGKHQKPFHIYKFRSMYQEAEKDGPRLSHDSDPRITPIGNVMRKYRLDELPQFWNVLKGDMSLVGPRPERQYYVRHIIKQAPYYALIFQVRPGITSWGMVKYGYASNVEEMVSRARYDLVYINNMSISTDIKILTYTVRTVITGEGK